MQKEQNMVHEFHITYSFARNLLHPRATTHPLEWMDVGAQRDLLISEEHLELKQAWRKHDVIGIADALGDLAYVVLGTAVACGINIEPLLWEIHRSNMTKTVGQFKPIKGKDYSPPELRPLLIAQGFTVKELGA